MEGLRRCRGVLLCDGTYTGCPYGDGDLTPLTGPYDCPVCHGSGIEGFIATILPHESFGDPDCCGCLNGIVLGDRANIVCNECQVVVRTAPASELQQTLDEMESTLDMCSDMCPHCGNVNLFPGFSRMVAYVCRECERPVNLGPDAT
jgi:hypothetical protein